MRVIFTLMLVLAAMGVNAQFTTSSMSGKVEDMQKEPIIGATIQAIHEASGTRYGAITNVDGRFSIQGMRTGKYTVEVSFIGYQSVKVTDATLQLGVNYPLDIYMKESSELLDEVVVVGTASKFAGVKTGAVTNVSSDQMQLLPSIDRSLSDFTRLSPYSGANNTLSGRDGRTNTFTIDGANLNNNFGLSSTLPGGGNPISLDAIEELQVVVAPFDVRQTNFVGGGVMPLQSLVRTCSKEARTLIRKTRTSAATRWTDTISVYVRKSPKRYMASLSGGRSSRTNCSSL